MPRIKTRLHQLLAEQSTWLMPAVLLIARADGPLLGRSSGSECTAKTRPAALIQPMHGRSHDSQDLREALYRLAALTGMREVVSAKSRPQSRPHLCLTQQPNSAWRT